MMPEVNTSGVKLAAGRRPRFQMGCVDEGILGQVFFAAQELSVLKLTQASDLA